MGWSPVGRLRIAVVGLCASVAVLVASPPALGQGRSGSNGGGSGIETSGRRTESGAQASVGQQAIPTSGRTAHKGGGARQVTCTRNAIDPVAPLGTAGLEVGVLAEGVQYWQSCFDAATGERISGPTLQTAGPAAQQGPALTTVLREQALANIDVELPVGRMSPPARTLPNVDTWLWSEQPGSTQASASAAGVTVTVAAELVGTSFTINPGTAGESSPDDGVTVRCDGAPTPYRTERPAHTQASACTHRFAAPTRDLTIDTTATWSLRWTATNGEGGDLGTIDRTSTTPYRVQAKATVIRTPG